MEQYKAIKIYLGSSISEIICSFLEQSTLYTASYFEVFGGRIFRFESIGIFQTRKIAVKAVCKFLLYHGMFRSIACEKCCGFGNMCDCDIADCNCILCIVRHNPNKRNLSRICYLVDTKSQWDYNISKHTIK